MREGFEVVDAQEPIASLDDALHIAEDINTAYYDGEDMLDKADCLATWVRNTLDYTAPRRFTAGGIVGFDLPGCEFAKNGDQFQINISARHVFNRAQLQRLASALLRIAED